MVDVFDKQTRRRIMRAVRTSETEPEERLAVALRKVRLQFRRNDRTLFGVPDFAFHTAKLAVFVDGDFWHGRTWFRDGAAPATNADFWIGKFERNRRRDRLVDRELRRRGWSVLRLWASDVRKNATQSVVKVQGRLSKLKVSRPQSRGSARRRGRPTAR